MFLWKIYKGPNLQHTVRYLIHILISQQLLQVKNVVYYVLIQESV